MSFAIPNGSHTASSTRIKTHSFGAALENAFNITTKKIKDAVTSPISQGIVGFGLGLGVHRIYGPLTEKIVKALGISTIFSDPFSSLGLGHKILLMPLICILGPIIEEKIFRGCLQETLNDKLASFYVNRGFSASTAHTAARVTAVFFASVIFGFIHFTNAIAFWCNPILFLPQVVAATLMGLVFGLAKEFSGELHMPIGMHIGNNTLAWAQNIKAFL
jgi:membrane protease YdiL (CAAX protease family)